MSTTGRAKTTRSPNSSAESSSKAESVVVGSTDLRVSAEKPASSSTELPPAMLFRATPSAYRDIPIATSYDQLKRVVAI